MDLGVNCAGRRRSSVKAALISFHFQEVKHEARIPWPFWRSCLENSGLLRHQSDV